ncbi:Protein kinase domain [Paramecium bursaria]
MSDLLDEAIKKKYEIVQRIGKGAYGVVWKAKMKGKCVALKKVFDAFNNPTDAQRTYREVSYLKNLRHQNIIQLIDTHPAENKSDLYMVFEYMETDLHMAIRAKILQPVHRKYIVYQILKALKYIHSSGLIHRDLKPANILLDQECRVKIADFGLARMVGSEDTDILTEYVATRWFRAPEILLGSKNYSFGVDLWSLGCMMGEMIQGKALFSGNSTLNQLEKIVEIIGSPSNQEIAALSSSQIWTQLSKHSKTKFNLDCDPTELDMIKRFLVYDPIKRLSVEDALKHPYMREFHNPKEEETFKGQMQLQLKDDKQYPINTYRDLLYKKMDFSKIMQLVTKQKKLLQDVTNKKKLQSVLSHQSLTSKSNNDTKLQRAQSNVSVKLRSAANDRQKSILSNSKFNVSHTSVSPQAGGQRLAKLLSKYHF